MADLSGYTLYSSGLKGAEAEFGRQAQRWGLNCVTYTFDGHVMDWQANVKLLSEDDLKLGDVSMEIVAKRMGRFFGNGEKIRRILQSIFHLVNSGHDVFAVGHILADDTVKGGTGWGVELAKFFNRPLYVYDQEQKAWFVWREGHWCAEKPLIKAATFTGLGTRYLSDEGQVAIEDLFRRSFGEPAN